MRLLKQSTLREQTSGALGHGCPPPSAAHAPSLGPPTLGVGGWVPEAAPAGPELRVRARAVREGGVSSLGLSWSLWAGPELREQPAGFAGHLPRR